MTDTTQMMIDTLLTAEIAYNTALETCLENGPELFIQTREKWGLTQQQLAKHLGVGYPYISKIENGHQPPGKPTLYRLAQLIKKLSHETPELLTNEIAAPRPRGG